MGSCLHYTWHHLPRLVGLALRRPQQVLGCGCYPAGFICRVFDETLIARKKPVQKRAQMLVSIFKQFSPAQRAAFSKSLHERGRMARTLNGLDEALERGATSQNGKVQSDSPQHLFLRQGTKGADFISWIGCGAEHLGSPGHFTSGPKYLQVSKIAVRPRMPCAPLWISANALCLNSR